MTKILQQNSNRHKRVELWAKSIKDFGNFGRHFSCASTAKILAACTRVSKVMAGPEGTMSLFSSHIMGPAAYGLRPRLWLLVTSHYNMLYKYGKRTRDFLGRFYFHLSAFSINQ